MLAASLPRRDLSARSTPLAAASPLAAAGSTALLSTQYTLHCAPICARQPQVDRPGRFYGSFAEIGAGQEVSRWFFQVGAAAGTVPADAATPSEERTRGRFVQNGVLI